MIIIFVNLVDLHRRSPNPQILQITEIQETVDSDTVEGFALVWVVYVSSKDVVKRKQT